MNHFKILLLILWISVVAGCAHSPIDHVQSEKIKNLASPSLGQAGLYILGGSAGHDVWLNGRCLGYAGPSGFFYIEVEPEQEHWISTDNLFFPDHVQITAKTGEFYYIQQYAKLLSWNILLQGPIPSDVRQLTTQQGLKKITDRVLIQPNSCIRKSMPLPENPRKK